MTPLDIQTNQELRLSQFPVSRTKTFLAHAGVCPLPEPVARAIREYAQEASRGDQEKFVFPEILENGRATVARFLGCDSREIAFVGPTSLGLSFVASGLKLKRGDNILIYLDDYPSNVYPWMALAKQGVDVRFLPSPGPGELGRIRPADILSRVDENTRLVALASCHFISGYRIDVSAIGSQLRQRNILFCLDAIQTLGAFPVELEHVDMMAADAHKWMLGPCGAGILYVRGEVQDRINPPIYGWHNVRSPDFIAQEQMVLRTDARKYEAGTHNLLGIVGLLAALEMIEQIGVETISRDLLQKRNLLISSLQAKGWSVLHADAPPGNSSGIVSFYRPGQDPKPLHDKLSAANIITSLRTDRKRQNYIRLSPHFYNTDEELNRALELM